MIRFCHSRFPILRGLLFILLGYFSLSMVLPQEAVAQREPQTAAQEFADAFRLYADQLYEQAVKSFDTFRTTYPNHVNAAEALYYEAESSLALGREEEAVRLFSLFNHRYPAHPLAFQARLALGKYYFDAGSYERSLEALDQVLSENPPPEVGGKALYWMAEAAIKLDRMEEALVYYQRAADEYPSASTAPNALYAIAYNQVQLDRPDEAARSFELLAERHPESYYARNIGLALAEVYYEIGDYQRAVDEIRRRSPDLDASVRERATFLLAESYNHLRDSDNATISYRQITEGDPTGPYYRLALYGSGWNYLSDDNYQWAADLFAQAREGYDDPLAAKATYYEGVSRKLAAQPREAIDLFETFVQTWPDHELADHGLHELAIAYYQERMWQEASETLGKLVASYPDSEIIGDAYYLQGNTFIALGNFDQALRSFDSAIALNSAPQSLKDEIVFQRAWLLYRNGAYSSAAPAFVSLYEKDPDGPHGSESLFWAAESFYQTEDYQEAEQLFKDYLRTFSNGKHTDAAHYALGWVYFKRDQYGQAIDEFQEFLDGYREQNETIPYRSDALLRIADSYYALKRYPDAIRIYRQVASEGGDYALYQEGQAYASAGNSYEAINTFRKLLAEHPESEWKEEAQYQVGYLYFLSQDYEQAIAEYQKILDRSPRDPLAAKAQYGIGDAYFNAGRMEEATEAYRNVLERYAGSPFAAEAASSIQYALIARGEGEQAQEVIEEFAEKNPNSPVVDELRFRQAEVKYQSGQIDEALEEMRDFVSTSSNTELRGEGYYYLALIAQDQGNAAEAESHLRRLIEGYRDSPRRPEAARRLGDLYLEQERFGDALAVFRNLEAMAGGDARLRAQASYGQSMALLNLGRTDEAEELLQDAIRSAPNAQESGAALLGLARVYEQSDRADEALELYRQIINRNRDEAGAEALYRLGVLLLERDRAEQALEELSRMSVLYAGYPEWIAQSYLAQARAFTRLGQTGDAARIYDRVMEEFAGQSYAEIAAREKAAL